MDIHSSFTILQNRSSCILIDSAQQEEPEPPWGAESQGRESNSGLSNALQQAGALPTELRHTLTELRRTLTELCLIRTELRRTLTELCHTLT